MASVREPHASFVADHSTAAGRVFEFTGSAISALILVDGLQGFFSSRASASVSQVSAEDVLARHRDSRAFGALSLDRPNSHERDQRAQ
jgi:hypothetical protein